jgi:nitroreductase
MPSIDVAGADRLLTTTRSVRKRLDLKRAVPPEVVERALEVAMQAPTGSNMQTWHFVVVTDPAKRAGLAKLYKRAFDTYRGKNPGGDLPAEDLRTRQRPRVVDSASFLADHLHEVPVHVIPCVESRFENGPVVMQASIYGSILPAVWSLMLALRARGVGSAWTTLHLMHEAEAAKMLGIPADVTQVALLPVAYFTGEDFKPAKRLPPADRTHWNGWGTHRAAGGR